MQMSGKTTLHGGLGHTPCRPQISDIKTEGKECSPASTIFGQTLICTANFSRAP